MVYWTDTKTTNTTATATRIGCVSRPNEATTTPTQVAAVAAAAIRVVVVDGPDASDLVLHLGGGHLHPDGPRQTAADATHTTNAKPPAAIRLRRSGGGRKFVASMTTQRDREHQRGSRRAMGASNSRTGSTPTPATSPRKAIRNMLGGPSRPRPRCRCRSRESSSEFKSDRENGQDHDATMTPGSKSQQLESRRRRTNPQTASGRTAAAHQTSSRRRAPTRNPTPRRWQLAEGRRSAPRGRVWVSTTKPSAAEAKPDNG